LKNYKGRSKLKKAAMNMLVKLLDKNQIESLEKEFKKYDKDGTGSIHLK
jgi:Ca2+-binding EF-hand superfamily protein